MNDCKTIRELVIDAYMAQGEMPPYEALTELVKYHFPKSKWQRSHYSWYKSQINTGRIDLSNTEENNVTFENEIEENISDSIDTQVSLEKDLQQYLANRVHEIESGLVVVDGGVEFKTEAGYIDILTKDENENLVVIELKAGKAKDAAIGQILGYIGCLSDTSNNVRGILVASSFDKRAVLAVKALPNIKLVSYELNFKLTRAC